VLKLCIPGTKFLSVVKINGAKQRLGILLAVVASNCSCENKNNKVADHKEKDSAMSCMQLPSSFGNGSETAFVAFGGHTMVSGMVFIAGRTFEMAGDNEQASEGEYPKHRVTLDGFYMDITEVTNAQFQKLVDATGYLTTAERKPDWEELKKTLPPGTRIPADSLLVAASLLFKQTNGPVDLNNYSQWWSRVAGANWKHPEGAGSSITGKENFPLVQVSWNDAMAYCKWADKRLPTEAEWEFAARDGLNNNIYPWGNEQLNTGAPKTNSWDGKFPYLNESMTAF
jgi:formylglycine-generating enzyme required for sulfatase activity